MYAMTKARQNDRVAALELQKATHLQRKYTKAMMIMILLLLIIIHNT